MLATQLAQLRRQDAVGAVRSTEVAGEAEVAALAWSALWQLRRRDERFGAYHQSLLFRETYGSVGSGVERVTDRGHQSPEVYSAVSAEVRRFCQWVTPHFLSRPAQKCLEWLLCGWAAGATECEALLCCALPYVGRPEFAQLVQALRLRDTPDAERWAWVRRVATRHDLVVAGTVRPWLHDWVSEAALELVLQHVHAPAMNAMYAAFSVRVCALRPSLAEHVLMRATNVLQRALSMPQHRRAGRECWREFGVACVSVIVGAVQYGERISTKERETAQSCIERWALTEAADAAIAAKALAVLRHQPMMSSERGELVEMDEHEAIPVEAGNSPHAPSAPPVAVSSYVDLRQRFEQALQRYDGLPVAETLLMRLLEAEDRIGECLATRLLYECGGDVHEHHRLNVRLLAEAGVPVAQWLCDATTLLGHETECLRTVWAYREALGDELIARLLQQVHRAPLGAECRPPLRALARATRHAQVLAECVRLLGVGDDDDESLALRVLQMSAAYLPAARQVVHALTNTEEATTRPLSPALTARLCRWLAAYDVDALGGPVSVPLSSVGHFGPTYQATFSAADREAILEAVEQRRLCVRGIESVQWDSVLQVAASTDQNGEGVRCALAIARQYPALRQRLSRTVLLGILQRDAWVECHLLALDVLREAIVDVEEVDETVWMAVLDALAVSPTPEQVLERMMDWVAGCTDGAGVERLLQVLRQRPWPETRAVLTALITRTPRWRPQIERLLDEAPAALQVELWMQAAPSPPRFPQRVRPAVLRLALERLGAQRLFGADGVEEAVALLDRDNVPLEVVRAAARDGWDESVVMEALARRPAHPLVAECGQWARHPERLLKRLGPVLGQQRLYTPLKRLIQGCDAQQLDDKTVHALVVLLPEVDDVACLAAAVRALGVRVVPALPHLQRHARGEVLEALLDTVPRFVSQQTIVQAMQRGRVEVMHRCPPRHVAAALAECAAALPRKRRVMRALAAALTKWSASEVRELYATVLASVLQVIESVGDEEEGQEREMDAGIAAYVALVLRVPERVFQQLYMRTLEWCDAAASEDTSRARALARLTRSLAETLGELFSAQSVIAAAAQERLLQWVQRTDALALEALRALAVCLPSPLPEPVFTAILQAMAPWLRPRSKPTPEAALAVQSLEEITRALAGATESRQEPARLKQLHRVVVRGEPQRALRCLHAMIEALGQELLPLLPDTLPLLAEWIEHADSEVERGAREFIHELERVTGEEVMRYLGGRATA